MGSKFIREPNMSNAAAAIYYNWAIGRIYRNIYFAIARQAPLDCVLVPYLDNCLLSLALPMEAFGGTPWLALTMRTMLHYPEMHISAPPQKFAALRRRLFYRMLGQRSMTAVLTIDPTLAEYAAQQGGSLRKIHYVPDPVKFHGALPARADARRWLNIPDSARVVLLYGELSTRKGAVALVEAAASPECSKQIHIVVAGRNRALPDFMNSPACQQLSTERRISSINALIDNEQEKLLLALSDCMWVGYIDFYGVSGVMAQAGRHGLPVIASDSGLIGHFTRHHELGLVVDPA